MNNTFNTDFSKAKLTAHSESHNQFLKDNKVDLSSGNDNQALPDGTAAVLGIAVNTRFVQKKAEENRPTNNGQVYLSPKGMWTVPFIMTVISHHGAKFISKWYPVQSEIQSAPTLEQYNALQGNERFNQINIDIMEAQDKQAAYAKLYKGQMTSLKMNENFIPDVIQAAKGIAWNDTTAPEFNLGENMFHTLDGMAFPAILKLNKDTGYGESNDIKSIILPFDNAGQPNPEYPAVMGTRLEGRQPWVPGNDGESFNTNAFDNQNANVSEAQPQSQELDKGFAAPAWSTN